LGPNLPPGVEGRPKGEIQCRFGNVRLGSSGKAKLPAGPTLLLVRWWGDAGPPLRMQLAPGSSDDACYPVCCGPKHLVRYLRDMSSLVLVLEEAYTHAPVGRCAVDVRFLDVGRPVSGTFPLLLPQNASRGGGVAAAVGTLMRHVGTLDVHLEIGYSTANITSFEVNEHVSAQDTRTPRSIKAYRQGGAPSTNLAEQQQMGQAASPQRYAALDVARFDQAMEQLDLFEVLSSRLQR
jgi:hypothetical protein